VGSWFEKVFAVHFRILEEVVYFVGVEHFLKQLEVASDRSFDFGYFIFYVLSHIILDNIYFLSALFLNLRHLLTSIW
jgi:hypothetical protein